MYFYLLTETKGNASTKENYF